MRFGTARTTRPCVGMPLWLLVPESGVQRRCAALSTIHLIFEWNGVALIVTTR